MPGSSNDRCRKGATRATRLSCAWCRKKPRIRRGSTVARGGRHQTTPFEAVAIIILLVSMASSSSATSSKPISDRNKLVTGILRTSKKAAIADVDIISQSQMTEHIGSDGDKCSQRYLLLQVSGTALLLSVVASGLYWIATKLKTNRTVISLASAIVLVLTTLDAFPKSVISMKAEAQIGDDNGGAVRAGMMSFIGFMVPLIIKACSRDDKKRFEAMIIDEDDPVRCETCEANGPQAEHTKRFPPTLITVTKHHGENLNRRAKRVGDYGPQVSDAHKIGSSPKHHMIKNAYHFLHGLFIGAAALASPCSLDETFVLISTSALLHQMNLEQAANDNDAKISMNSLIPRLLTSGAAASVAFAKNELIGIILAIACGVFVSIALIISITQVVDSHQEHESGEMHKSNRTGQNHMAQPRLSIKNLHLLNRSFEIRAQSEEYCMNCVLAKKSQAQAIPSVPKEVLSAMAKSNLLVNKYDAATWAMYHRIVSARESRARKCPICVGSLEENDSNLVSKAGTSRSGSKVIARNTEEERLIQACPSPLYSESAAFGARLTTEASALKVHKECYDAFRDHEGLIFRFDL